MDDVSSDLKPRASLFQPIGDKICLEHGKSRSLICINCQRNVCDTCALFGSHKGHDVRQKNELMSDIQIRMEMLMESYMSLD